MAGGWSAWYTAGPQGVHTARPFLDPRLIDFALRLPREIREVPGAAMPLLAGAMRGILPEPIRTRVHKRSFNDVFFLGLARHSRRLEALVRNADVDAVVDKPLLLRCLREAAHGRGQLQGATRIATTLSLILWLERLPRWRRPLAGGVVHHLAAASGRLAA
jgi:asparagine synthase (glutamine-hydrolysing)